MIKSPKNFYGDVVVTILVASNIEWNTTLDYGSGSSGFES